MKFREQYSTVSKFDAKNITTQHNTAQYTKFAFLLVGRKGVMKGNTRRYSTKCTKFIWIMKIIKFRRRKIRVHSQTHQLSHLAFIVTTQFLSSCCISYSEKTNPPLQHWSIETIKMLDEYSPLCSNKNWRSVRNDENTRTIQVSNLK